MPDRSLMVTGPRHLDHPAKVRARLASAYRQAGATLVVTGGAEGADTQAARAATDAQIPFDVYLPNRAYRLKYERAIPQVLLDRAREVRYTVNREVGDDWLKRWHAEKWWTDNFKRNQAMIGCTFDAVVVWPRHPRELLDPEVKGGTAHCTRALAKFGYDEVWWVPDVEAGEVSRASLKLQPSLFGGL